MRLFWDLGARKLTRQSRTTTAIKRRWRRTGWVPESMPRVLCVFLAALSTVHASCGAATPTFWSNRGTGHPDHATVAQIGVTENNDWVVSINMTDAHTSVFGAALEACSALAHTKATFQVMLSNGAANPTKFVKLAVTLQGDKMPHGGRPPPSSPPAVLTTPPLLPSSRHRPSPPSPRQAPPRR